MLILKSLPMRHFQLGTCLCEILLFTVDGSALSAHGSALSAQSRRTPARFPIGEGYSAGRPSSDTAPLTSHAVVNLHFVLQHTNEVGKLALPYKQQAVRDVNENNCKYTSAIILGLSCTAETGCLVFPSFYFHWDPIISSISCATLNKP